MQNEYVDALKSHASVLIEQLNRYGIKIKKTQALEVISHLQGQTDWNRVRAKLSEKLSSKPPVRGEGYASFSIIGIPGCGKTEALKTLMCLEEADGVKQPIFICLSGGAHTFRNEVDDQVSGNNWTVTYTAQGEITVEKPSKVYARPHIVNLISERKGSRVGIGLALANFLTPDPEGIAKYTVGSVLIDEFHCLEEEDEVRIIRAVDDFSRFLDQPIRQLVIASQVILRSKARAEYPDMKHLVEATLSRKYADTPGFEIVHSAGAPPGLYQDWDSGSIDDPCIVKDIFRSVMQHMSRDDWRKGNETRMKYVIGTSLWFRDLRNSLLR